MVAMIRLLCFLLLLLVQTQAYRVGEDIDTKVSLNASPFKDVLRSQAPMFGIATQSRFQVGAADKQENGDDDDDATTARTTTSSSTIHHHQPASISLSFEYGLWALPNIPVLDSRGRTLESVIVTFVYSRSGNGAIHSVTSQANYSTNNNYNQKKKATRDEQQQQQQQQQQQPETVSVSYQWIEEQRVQITAGQTVMYMIVVLGSVLGLIASCSSGNSDVATMERNGAGSEMAFTTTSSSAPKWD